MSPLPAPAPPAALRPGPDVAAAPPQLDLSARPTAEEHTVSRPVRHRRARTTSEIDHYHQPAARSASRGPVAEFFRWLIGLAVWIALAVLLTVVVIGAWWSGPLAGVITTALALVVAYFMVRER